MFLDCFFFFVFLRLYLSVLGKMLLASHTCVPETDTDLWPSLRYEDNLTTFPQLMSEGLLRLNYFPHCEGGRLDEVFVDSQVKQT